MKVSQHNDNDYLEQEGLEKTHNARGFMHPMTWPALEFVEYASQCKFPVMDIGCAYGVATIAALKKKARVFATDICRHHLEVLKKRVPLQYRENLTTNHSEFPGETKYSDEMFEAVLISHLLQYLSGNQMTEAFVKIYQWLKPGGKLFIVTYSPYHKTLQDYIPHYEEKVKMGVRWPGYISDKRAYNTAPKQIKENMPENIHLFNVDVLTRELKACGFIIEKAEMFGGEAAGVPKLFVLNGKQMVGVVAKKPG